MNNLTNINSRLKRITLFTLFLFSFFFTNAQVSSLERQALISIYNTLGGANWTNTVAGTQPWLINDVNSPVSDWYGVTVENNTVVGLDLSSNNLVGDNSLIVWGDLSGIKELDLGNNSISGDLVEIRNITSLEKLILSNNQFGGAISLNGLPNLTYIKLNQNNFIGELDLEALSDDLSIITYLDLNNNQLEGPLGNIGQMTSISYLNLGRNSFEGQLPAEIGNLTALTSLNIFLNNFSGELPIEFFNLSNLNDFNASFNNFSGVLPTNVDGLSSLKFFNIEGNNFSGAIPTAFGNIGSLQRFNITDNNFSGTIPLSFANLPSFQFLRIEGNNLSGALPLDTSTQPNLIVIDIEDNAFVFSDLEPNYSDYLNSVGSGNFIYVNQAKVDQAETLNVNVGQSITLTSNVLTSNNNQYQWYKTVDGVTTSILNANSKDLVINNATTSDAGIYHFEATNTVVTGLTLERNPITLTVSEDTCGVSATERQALIDFYNATDGPNWTNNTNWNTTAPVCDWVGVTVVDGKVERLSLYYNGLNGTIPTSFGDLIHLKYLNLSVNNITGVLDNSITNLTNLDFLNLERNAITGDIPANIGNLTLMTYLNLGSNQFSGTIPTSIGQLTNLDVLNLFRNQLTGIIPSEIGNLVNLTELNLYTNNLTGSLPITIGNLSLLKNLSLHINGIGGPLPDELGNLAALENLSLERNDVTGTIPSSLGNLMNLKVLNLGNNELTGMIPSELGNLTNLNTLHFFWNQLDGEIPDELGNLINLENLTFEKNFLTGLIPDFIGNLPALKILTLSNNQFTGEVPTTFTNLTNLQHLALDRNSLSGTLPVGIKALSETGNLNVLKFDSNNFVFKDFENEHLDYQSNLSTYNYSPQAKVDQTETLSVIEGGTITLTSNVLSSSDNVYKWFKDNIEITGETGKELVINNATLSDAGVYYFTATNTVVTGLTLERNPITLDVTEDLCGVSEAERQALWDIYVATNGETWTNTQSNTQPWDLSISVCDWYGVTVVNGQVQGLNLPSNNLQGTIPGSISSLLHLTNLNLDNNQILGQIPSSLGSLLELTSLILSNNQLSGNIPPTLGSLSNLTIMDLSNNSLEGVVPIAFCNLSNASILDLSFNQLGGMIPKELSILSLLTRLDLRNNQFTGTVPAQLASLGNLEFLGLSNNLLSGSLPFTVSQSSNLDELLFDNNQFIFSNFENKHLGYSQYLNVGYAYIPQAKTDAIETKMVTVGNSIVLSTVLSSENNNYQWYKISNGVETPITGGTARTLTISNASLSDAGIYYFKATNDIITGLTLERNPVTLVVDETCDVTIAQRQALIDLYNATGGSNWTNTQNNNQPWLVNDATSKICDWYGVVVDNTGAIIELNLGENNLNGVIPDVFASLPSLQKLIVNGNSLQGSLPTSLSGLTTMQELRIESNYYVFADIQPRMSSYTGFNFQYSPQANVDESFTQSINYNADYTLTSTKLTQANNQYQWYKNGLSTTGATTKDYLISLATDADEGVYFLEATNMDVPGLTIMRNPITIDVRAEGDTCGVSETEKQALIDLFNATDGPNWTNNTNWNTSAPVCDWYGVTVVEGKIRTLDLEANNLTGQIPNTINQVEFIQVLVLNQNQLSGTIPITLFSLTELKQLELSENSLSGSLPNEIGNLVSLEYLKLEDNVNLSGSIPANIGNLTNLIEISLQGNNFSGIIPVEIGNLNNVRSISFNNNVLEGQIPLEIAQLSSLEYFSIADNRISGNLSMFSGIPTLNGLDIYTNEFIFNDFELYFNSFSGFQLFRYSPQANVDEVETKTVVEGQSITLTSDVLVSSNNIYKWFKKINGVYEEIAGATTKEYVISGATTSDAGEYIFRATNAVVTNLTLERNPITVEVLPAGACLVSDSDRQALIDFYNAFDGTNWTNTTSVIQPWLINDPTSNICDWYGVTVSADYKITGIDLPNNNLRGEIPDALSVLDELVSLNLSQNNVIGEIPVSLTTIYALNTLNLRENVLVGAIPEEIINLTGLETLDLGQNRLSSIIPTNIGNLQSLKYLDLSVNKLEDVIPESLYSIITLEFIKLQENNLIGGISTAVGNLVQLKEIWLSQNNLSGNIPASWINIPGLYSIRLDNNSFGGDLPLLIPNYALPNTEVQIQNNRFVFSDFEPEHPDYTTNLSVYSYIPQAKVDQTEVITVQIGGDATLFTNDLTSPSNTYQWFKGTDALIETTQRELLITNIQESDLGTYYFTATNSTIDGLVLIRYSITLQLENVNPPVDDCDALIGIADGSFESCFDQAAVVGSGNSNNDISCAGFTSVTNNVYTWKIDTNSSGGSGELNPQIEASPNGGVFSSTRVEVQQGEVVGFPLQVITRNIENLNIGTEYEFSYYQSNGGFIGAASDFNSNWNVGVSNATTNTGDSTSSSLMLVQSQGLNTPPSWSLESFRFVANSSSVSISFTPVYPDLSTVDNGVIFHLLLDGIKVKEVNCGGGSGDASIQSFCLAENDEPTIGDLISPINGISQVSWYTAETGGLLLNDNIFLTESVTLWAEGQSTEPRVQVQVNLDYGISGYDLTDLNYQEFSILSASTIADLQPQGPDIQWYSSLTGGLPLNSTDLLIDGNIYYAQQNDNSCRFATGVFVGVRLPDTAGRYFFCASSDPILRDIDDQIIKLPGHTLKWYTSETGSSTAVLEEGLLNNAVYYVVQVDGEGNESERSRITVTVSDPDPPIVLNTEQVFFSNDPVTVAQLRSTSANVIWFNEAGEPYRPSDYLQDGQVYYAAQGDPNCLIEGALCCTSTIKVAVTVRIFPEQAPRILSCEKFRPQPGDRYVISGWVREDGLEAVNPVTSNFNEVSDVFVDLLNHLVNDRVLSGTGRDRIIPAVYVPQSRQYDVLIPYIPNAPNLILTIYNFEYIKEMQGEDESEKTIGFRFAFSPDNNAPYFEYRSPKVVLDYPTEYNDEDRTADYSYPLFNNPGLKLNFKNASICGANLCVNSSFEIQGQSNETVVLEYTEYQWGPGNVTDQYNKTVVVNIGYNNQNISNSENSASIFREQITKYDYVVDQSYQVMDYANSMLRLKYTDAAANEIPLQDDQIIFKPKGAIIDGWQQILADFTIPLDAKEMTIALESNLENDPSAQHNVYFDDIRIHPYDSNMKTFVYDPLTQRLQAELDENNFATYYEYDQEGGLIRVKKETERGIFTIQETRSGNAKRTN